MFAVAVPAPVSVVQTMLTVGGVVVRQIDAKPSSSVLSGLPSGSPHCHSCSACLYGGQLTTTPGWLTKR